MSNSSTSIGHNILATITSVGRVKRVIGRRRMQPHKGVRTRIAVATSVVALAIVGSAAAFQALPPGGQVNDDLAAGIDKTISVNGDSPTNSDVVGGALTAG